MRRKSNINLLFRKSIRFLLIFTIFLLSAFLAIKTWRLLEPEDYPRINVETEMSEDRIWIASVNEDHFSIGFGGDTLLDVVSLGPSAHPDQAIDLLGVDTGGHDKERPRIAWTSSNRLNVTVSSLIFVKVRTLHVGGVQVDLHLDPDDPLAVAAWLREKGLVPGTAGEATVR